MPETNQVVETTAQVPGSTCGDGFCQEKWETACSCPQECSGECFPICGNGACENGEDVCNCPPDCGVNDCASAVCPLPTPLPADPCPPALQATDCQSNDPDAVCVVTVFSCADTGICPDGLPCSSDADCAGGPCIGVHEEAIACDCRQNPDECHPELADQGVFPPVNCVGPCPNPDDVCELISSDTNGDGLFDQYECRCPPPPVCPLPTPLPADRCPPALQATDCQSTDPDAVCIVSVFSCANTGTCPDGSSCSSDADCGDVGPCTGVHEEALACDCRQNPEDCHPELADQGAFPPVNCVGPCPNPADVCELISSDTNGDGLFDQYECRCPPPPVCPLPTPLPADPCPAALQATDCQSDDPTLLCIVSVFSCANTGICPNGSSCSSDADCLDGPCIGVHEEALACDCRQNPDECHPELADQGVFPPVNCVGPCPNLADVCALISSDTNNDGLFDQYECRCGPPLECESDADCPEKCEDCDLGTNTCVPIPGCCASDADCPAKCEVCDTVAGSPTENTCVLAQQDCCVDDLDCDKCETCEPTADPNINRCQKTVPDCCASDAQCPNTCEDCNLATSTCEPIIPCCGNGVVELPEECDGNLCPDGQPCNADCTCPPPAVCPLPVPTPADPCPAALQATDCQSDDPSLLCIVSVFSCANTGTCPDESSCSSDADCGDVGPCTGVHEEAFACDCRQNPEECHPVLADQGVFPPVNCVGPCPTPGDVCALISSDTNNDGLFDQYECLCGPPPPEVCPLPTLLPADPCPAALQATDCLSTDPNEVCIVSVFSCANTGTCPDGSSCSSDADCGDVGPCIGVHEEAFACDCRQNPEECHPVLAEQGVFPPVDCVGPCPNPDDVCELISSDTNDDGLFDQYECQCGPPGGVCNPQCPNDILEFDGSGFSQEIDAWELANLLGCWSIPGPPGPCPPLTGSCVCFDFDGDGCISAIDLAGSVLGEWGACCDNRCIEGESCLNCAPNECTSETWCADGVDNDCDGLIDCDDPDCTGDPDCP